MSEYRDIRCTRCDKLLAKDKGPHLEIKNGQRAVRIFEARAVTIDCSRCGMTMDVPSAMQKPVEAGS